MHAKSGFRALVLAAAAATPFALAGCGTGDAPNPAGVSSSSVDPDDPKAWDEFLRSLDITPALREDVGTERGAGKRGAYLIYPAGEVRKAGLHKFRIDVTSDFDAKGTLRFTKGAKTLYEAPFDPAALTKESFVAQLPSAVLETVAVGDTVKWGLYFEDKRVKDVTTTFKVIDKSQATKEIAKKIDGNKALASTPTVRDLARAEILMNYSLYSEAIELLSDVAASDKTLQAPYLPLANALRRLRLKDSPIFQESALRASVQTTPRHGGVPGGGEGALGVAGGPGGESTGIDPKAGLKLKSAAVRSTLDKSAGNGPKGLAPGGSVPAGLRGSGSQLAADQVPADAKGAWDAYVQAFQQARARAEAARHLADQLKRTAEDLAAKAAALTDKAKAAGDLVAQLQAKLDAAKQALDANPNDPALAQQVVDLNEQLQAAQKNAQDLAAQAAKAQHEADLAAKAAADAERAAQQSALTVDPGAPVPPPTSSTDPTAHGLPTLAQATANLQKAYQDAAAAEKTVESALQALTAADEALANAPPNDGGAAAQARDAAYQAYLDALQAAAAANAAAQSAEETLQKVANASK